MYQDLTLSGSLGDSQDTATYYELPKFSPHNQLLALYKSTKHLNWLGKLPCNPPELQRE